MNKLKYLAKHIGWMMFDGHDNHVIHDTFGLRKKESISEYNRLLKSIDEDGDYKYHKKQGMVICRKVYVEKVRLSR